MVSPDSFRAFYDSTLLPKFGPLEHYRKELWQKLLRYGGGAAAAGIILEIVGANIGLLITAIAVAGTIYFYRQYKQEFRDRYKQEVVGTVIRALGLQYDHNRRIERPEYERSKLFLDSINRYYGDDLVTGMVDKTAIRFSEVFTQHVSSNGENTTVRTIFRGILFVADFNKKFVGETIVLPDRSEKAFGSLGAFFQKMNFVRPELVKMEDPEFEKHFVVYGTDQVEARYILSTALMQRILTLRNKVNKGISLSFIDSHVYIGLPIDRNLFEPPALWQSIDNYKQIEEYHYLVSLCMTIVEVLDLNTRIWTKE